MDQVQMNDNLWFKRWPNSGLQNREEIWQKSQLEINSQQTPTTADASVQVDTQKEDIMRTWETAAALVENTDEIIEQEVEEAVAYLMPSPID